ncbi:MAG TPA: hypothetical protein VFM02_03895 [Candidatus Paceibacterota bacterium]|nr:hypothetical protein [Candidatus Paceibacterota bacterium]
MRCTSPDARRISDLGQIRIALKDFRFDHGKYPATLQELQETYMTTVPVDPKTNHPYLYGTNGVRTDFRLGATLENKHNSALESDIDESAYGVDGTDPNYVVGPDKDTDGWDTSRSSDEGSFTGGSVSPEEFKNAASSALKNSGFPSVETGNGSGNGSGGGVGN